MKDPFEFEAKYYDIVWSSSCDYPREAELLDNLFKSNNIKRVLDVACGTGGHAIELAKLGYSVIALDISTKMLEIASEKAAQADVKVRFVEGDMTELAPTLKSAGHSQDFDAVICLGFSMAHLTTDDLLSKTLRGISEVLKSDGLCIFSVRNAKMSRESMMNRLLPDVMVHEKDFSLALFGHTYRDKDNPNTLVWNAIYLVNDHGKVDFQVRTRHQRRFQYAEMTSHLAASSLETVRVYGDTYGLQEFKEDQHRDMIFVCKKK